VKVKKPSPFIFFVLLFQFFRFFVFILLFLDLFLEGLPSSGFFTDGTVFAVLVQFL